VGRRSHDLGEGAPTVVLVATFDEFTHRRRRGLFPGVQCRRREWRSTSEAGCGWLGGGPTWT
jgi:hypothetical protein